MKALRFEKTGTLDNLKLEEIDQPQPAEGEVLVQVKAAAINPSDIKNVLGKMHETTTPRTPGRDFAGIVVDGPEDLIGTAVFGTGGNLGFGRDGSHAEFIAVPETVAVPMPGRLTFEHAAILGLPFITAQTALMSAAAVHKGDFVLITGATGAVGRAATAIVSWLGGKVIGVARSKSRIPAGNEMPVAHWIDLESGPLAQQVREITGGHGADVVLDVVGGPMFEQCLGALAPKGWQVAIASGPERRVSFDLIDFYHNQSHLIGVDSLKLTFEQTGAILRVLAGGITAGTFPSLANPEKIRTFPMENAREAYQQIAEGRLKEKAVITP